MARHRPGSIHLLHNTPYERENLEPLAVVAERRGYAITFSDRKPQDDVEISIYSGHAQEPDLSRTDPAAAGLSVVMLHDLGQSMWPSDQTEEANLWASEPWDVFDVGILPGPAWSRAWRLSSTRPAARPRIGVFELGYPKADRVAVDRASLEDEARQLASELGLRDRPSILLAPSWESDEHNRCEGFIRALDGLEVNRLVKYQAPADERRMAERFGDAVTFIPASRPIMTCLAMADIVVSDESNCLAEAILLDVPGMAVLDWDVPAVPSWGVPSRSVDPPSFVQQVPSARLRPTITSTLADLPRHRREMRHVREDMFTNLGSSAETIVDLLDAIRDLPARPVPPRRV